MVFHRLTRYDNVRAGTNRLATVVFSESMDDLTTDQTAGASRKASPGATARVGIVTPSGHSSFGDGERLLRDSDSARSSFSTWLGDCIKAAAVTLCAA
jgi:hypothetical protein